MKKCYTGNIRKDGVIIGSGIVWIWFWQSAVSAHIKLGSKINAEEKGWGLSDFRRVR